MKKILLTFLLVLLISSGMEAQRRNGLISRRGNSNGSITFSTGPAYCFGDPFGSPFEKSFINGTNWEAALGFSQLFQKTYGYRATLHYGNYSGTDGNVPKPHTGYYSFRSNLFEFTARGEYAYFFGRKYAIATPNSVRGFFGFGVMDNIASFPAGTRVGKTSPTFAVLIPYGVAYQYDIRNSNFSFGAELGWQYIFSDYVDGYSPNPNSRSNDVLANFKATFTYKIF